MIKRVRLRTASRLRLRFQRPPASVAARNFAARLFARYVRRGAAREDTLDLLLSMRSPLFVQNVMQRFGVEVTTTPLVLLARKRYPRRELSSPREPRCTSSAAAGARRWSRQADERAQASSALLHLVQRAVRLEAAPYRSATPAELVTSTSTTAGSVGDAAGPLPVVSRSIDSPSIRKLLNEHDTRAREATAGSSPRGDSSERPATGTQARRLGTELDIEHLADRVISSIDRRIVTQRERLGRN